MLLRLSRRLRLPTARRTRFSGASVRCFGSSIPEVRRSQVASKRDITGSKLSLSISRDGLTLIDEAIMNMITSESDPLPQIRDCLGVDKDCALAHALLVMELCRNPTASMLVEDAEEEGEGAHVGVNEIKASLENMETNFAHLNERERYLGAASLQCVRGHYSEAAALLESAIMLNPGDAISLRLAQDCYIMAGDAKNALSEYVEYNFFWAVWPVIAGDFICVVLTFLLTIFAFQASTALNKQAQTVPTGQTVIVEAKAQP